ncbi:hypothetical protein BH11CYA1_BH11CYA1_07380 [soil metagenome]
MFCVVYQWKVRSGKEDEFRETWRTITEAIFAQHGTYGSRLHESDHGTWIAYAQWPDRERWEHVSETLGVDLERVRQAECLLEQVEVLFTLTVTDDLLKPAAPKLRVARPSDNLEAVVRFYVDGLGLQVLSRFENHEGFDGVMVGAPDSVYHFEFTRCIGHTAAKAPSQDNLIVVYLPQARAWEAAVARMTSCGYEPVKSFNPYWELHGKTFEDPDGYRVVLQNADWEPGGVLATPRT